MASSPGMWATLGGGEGRDRDSPRGRFHPLLFTEMYSILLHTGLVHLCPKRNPPDAANKKTTWDRLTSLYQPTMSSKLPTNFRKVSYWENRFSALLGMSFCRWKFRYLTSLSTATN